MFFEVAILKISEKYVIILTGIINHKENICRCKLTQYYHKENDSPNKLFV